MSRFNQSGSNARPRPPPSLSTTSRRLGSSFPLQLPKFSRLRRHPATILRTTMLVIVLALPAYVFLSYNAPGNDNGADRFDVQYAGENVALPKRPGSLPGHIHSKETNANPGPDRENSQQGVLRSLRGAALAAVEQGHDQTLVKSDGIKVENRTARDVIKWRMYGGVNASYQGCFPDSIHPQQRTLRGAFTSDLRRMTVETCLQYCTKRNFLYGGLQYYSECYCGSTLERPKADNKSLCNLPCAGNKTQVCGGAPYLSVYRLSITPGQAPNRGVLRNVAAMQQQVRGPKPGNDEGPVPGYKDGFRTCAVRPTDDSYFTKYFEESDQMTVAYCVQLCEKQALPLAALFRGSQCHCGYLTHNYTLRHTVDHSECQEVCKGDAKTFCGGAEHYAIYQSGVEDTRCTQISMGQPGQFPLVALASFPGSGNTWVRYLIERATGYYTGSIYDDGDLYRKGFLGEREDWRKGKTVAIKSHRFDEEHVASFDGAILIIRNPYKAMISEHNRKFGGHTGFASEKHYTQGTEWIDFVAGKSRTWTNSALNYLQYSRRILVIHYEELRSDAFLPLQKMVRFLGQTIDEERILCTLSSPDGKFKRRESSRQKLSFDPFTDEMREMIGLYVKSVDMALKLKNQTALPGDYNPQLRL
ncbi:sialate:O-sulfotransferase 2-like [Diadema setosum]|uniref:sialate:O-sulfotransferase 2-like n=1 Tax=Diadema setosum TaxID=31175 RepID=UPI003B3A6A3B